MKQTCGRVGTSVRVSYLHIVSIDTYCILTHSSLQLYSHVDKLILKNYDSIFSSNIVLTFQIDDDIDEEFLLGDDTEEVQIDLPPPERPISPIKFSQQIKTEPSDSTSHRSSGASQHKLPVKPVKRESQGVKESKPSVKSRLGKKIKIEPKTYQE